MDKKGALTKFQYIIFSRGNVGIDQYKKNEKRGQWTRRVL